LNRSLQTLLKGLAVVALAVAGTTAFRFFETPKAIVGQRSNEVSVERIYDRCVDQMVRSSCVAMNDKSPSTPRPGARVFVAGIGAIDAESYRQIRESGEAMCTQIRKSCETDFDGAQCRTAASLWGARDGAEDPNR
jgi:hypothetical protein